MPIPAIVIIEQKLNFALHLSSFVPEVGFSNYNQASFQPQIEVEVPSAVAYWAPVFVALR